MRYIPGMGRLQLFVYAAVFAVLVWIVGLVLSQVLRETGMPLERDAGLRAGRGPDRRGASTRGCRCLCRMPSGLMLNLPEKAYPLIGAVLGYHIRR